MKKYLLTILCLAAFAAGAFAASDFRTLRIYVQDHDNEQPLDDVKIMLSTFEIDENDWWRPDVQKSSVAYTENGLVVFDGDNEIDLGVMKAGDQEYNNIYRNYQLIITSHSYSPTTREQMIDSQWGQKWVWIDRWKYKATDYEIISVTATLTKMKDTASVTVGSVVVVYPETPGLMFFCEIRTAGNWESIVQETFITTDTVTTFQFSNIPVNAANLRVNIYCPQKDIGREVPFPVVYPISLGSTDMGASVKADIKQTGDPVFQGVFKSESDVPIENARVRITLKGDWVEGSTFTDSKGYFVFYDSLVRVESEGSQSPFFIHESSYIIRIEAQYYEGMEFEYLYDENNVPIRLGIIKIPNVYGVISGTVTLSGTPLPNAHVNVWGDWSSWEGSDDPDPYAGHNKGAKGGGFARTDVNGWFEIEGLSGGNYRLEVYSDFTQQPYCFNNGLDGQEDIDKDQNYVRSGDDYRITVSTKMTDISKFVTRVYNSDGEIQISSHPLKINIPANKNNEGSISGTITYDESFISPNVNLGGTDNIFMVIARQDWSTFDPYADPWVPAASGFTSITDSGTSFPYTINVPTGYLYQMEVISKNYGVLRQGGEMKADLRDRSSASGMDFIITPGGTVKGRVLLPDGSVFKPLYGDSQASRGCNINIHGRNVESWGNAEVKEDGTFEINGLVPGTYSAEVYGWGNLFQWASPRMDNISVRPLSSGATTFIEVKLRPGARCLPEITGGLLNASLTNYERILVFAMPAGIKLDNENMKNVLMRQSMGVRFNNHGGSFEPMYLAYGLYDFYVIINGDTMGRNTQLGADNKLYYYFAGQSKNVQINEDPQVDISEHLPSQSGFCHLIEIGTEIGSTSITGSLTGKNVIKNSDLAEISKNLDYLIEYIPSVIIYDTTGTIKGWSLEVPDPAGMAELEEMFFTKDFSRFPTYLARNPLKYVIPRLKTGRYTYVAETPNYPPVVKIIDLNSDMDISFSFDSEVGEGGTIKGVVRSASGMAIPSATLTLKSNMRTRITRTDSQGRYEFYGLPRGRYTVDVSRSGFALAGARRNVEKNSTIELNFNLTPAAGSFSGTVFLQKFPSPRVFPGAKITAYDETFNYHFQNEYLPAYTVTSDANGKYAIPGVIEGNKYKIYLIVDGNQLEFVEKTATAGEVTGCDFVLRSEAPKLDIKSKISSDNRAIYYTVKSPKALASAPLFKYKEGTVDNESLAFTEITNAIELSENEYRFSIVPDSSDKDYVLRIEADDGANEKVTVDTVFNLSQRAKLKKDIKEEWVEGGDIFIGDSSDDFTAVGIPTGGLTPSGVEGAGTAPAGFVSPSAAVGGFITALPQVQITRQNRSAAAALSNFVSTVLASDLYTIDLSSAQINRDLTLSFNYDKTRVTDLDAIRIYQYNESSGQWDLVPGTTMVDPITGTISVDVETISNASGVVAQKAAPKAAFDGRRFVINPNAETSQTGVFAVFSAPPPDSKSYAGGEFKAYNFPNPFNLKNKTLTLTDDLYAGTTMDTQGTIIKYYMPASVNGRVDLFIYNLAGEMVRRIEDGNKEGGYIYYVNWDGRNDNGSSVASGVYFCNIQVDGKKKKLFKMAVIK